MSRFILTLFVFAVMTFCATVFGATPTSTALPTTRPSTQQCRQNEEWNQCATMCPERCCQRRQQICPMACMAGCQCKNGFVRNRQNRCIPRRFCRCRGRFPHQPRRG